jgi:CheY-like chemotaxis protein
MSNETIGRPMEILLVEDSLLDARLTMSALKRGGLQHRLTLMRDGQEAMEFLLKQGRFSLAPSPDLILLDLFLPKKDGLDVLAEVKSMPDLQEIPIVILTSADDEAIVQKINSYDIEQYIHKPVNYDKFLDVIRQLKHHWHNDLILPALD